VQGLTLASEVMLASELASVACQHINCQPLDCKAIPPLASVATKWLTIDVLKHKFSREDLICSEKIIQNTRKFSLRHATKNTRTKLDGYAARASRAQ